MEKHILVPMTHAEESDKALEYAITNFPDAEFTVIHVINPGYQYGVEGYVGYEQIMEQERRKANELFGKATEIAASHGVTITTEQLTGHTPTTILQYADEQQADQIVLGSRGRGGISRLLLGSVAEAVTRRSSIPVTIVR
ncbi:universal stress protein [Halalkalicoccus sp. NIPERK01]|uniref:universal stress protein n=1 Tax=Halalkalicoccus sp. NIPERK01 TaxID=3053469 RepID=UPI00256EBC9C|nr:universal stress protein [Halalkalicoccus sp. NIPERK01]MDL5363176.1 universal stress protein [Halalkalicoccus sp. NIPERK01]